MREKYFDWKSTMKRRPVFSVDYWPGVPALEHEGRKDITWDLEHIKAYADPAGVRTLQFYLEGDGIGLPGSYKLPDLISSDESEILKWQEFVKKDLEELLGYYRCSEFNSIIMSQLFQNSGEDTSPGWYRNIEDWDECDIDGHPLSQVSKRTIGCFFNPKMYEVIDRYWKTLSFLKNEKVIIGACIDNEPCLEGYNLSSSGIPAFGGNPHTTEAFKKYLNQAYKDIDILNKIAGTSFGSFDEISPKESNWLIRTMFRKFLSTIIIGEYLKKLSDIAKKHFPNLITITRLVSGYWMDLNNGEPRAEQMGVEETLLKDSSVDIIAWTHYWLADENPELMGQLQITAGLLRGVGKPLGITEPHVVRNGAPFTTWRLDELRHFVYRALYYRLGMFNLHSWDRKGFFVIDNEPFGSVLSQRPGYLKAIRELRDELEWIAPYETFGEPVKPPLRILVSRNARHFPGMQGFLYQNWLRQLCIIMEDYEFSNYEILEEQSNDLPSELKKCKGIVVVDACLEKSTHKLLEDFSSSGGKLLIIGAPAMVDELYNPCNPQPSYPFNTMEGYDLSDIEGKPLPKPVQCFIKTPHTVWEGPDVLLLDRPVALQPKTDSSVVAFQENMKPAVVANDKVFYVSGFPHLISQQKKLLAGFSKWCGISAPEMFCSAFEKAVVVQNWDSKNMSYDGNIIDKTPKFVTVPINGEPDCQIRELRQDHPWLAYHKEGENTILESVLLNPLDIKVFRREEAKALPHFEGLPDTLGFSFWWRGQVHPATGRFIVKEHTEVDARFVSDKHSEKDIGWFVCEVAGNRIAGGTGSKINFKVSPGTDYYLTVFLLKHPNQSGCPICQRSSFE